MKKTKKNYVLIFNFTFLMFFLCGCASLTAAKQQTLTDGQENSFFPDRIEWQSINSTCEYFVFTNKKIPLKWHCVKIDLSSPQLKITAFPSEQQKLKRGIKISRFAKRTESFVCFNTSPFAKKSSGKKTLVGIHKVEGRVFSPPQQKYSALAFKRQTDESLKAFVLENQDEKLLEDFDYAFGGFFTVLLNDKIKDFSCESKNSRTAAGITKDGRTLFILVAEGELPFKSRGLSYPDCAQIMQKLGASDCLEMDGGSSSALFIDGRNVLSYPVLWKQATFIGFKIENN